ncbi:MAG: hypothetical protein QGG40_14255, partial [Myxococcota bacterium]|jgi:cell division protease FtsH|nr:hypothetical protein [Myxococcota bacterium]
MHARLSILMGGRAAEDVVLNEFSTGASDDLRKATGIARAMVTEYGMSEVVGPVHLVGERGSIFLGRDFGRTDDFSEETARAVDGEVKRILDAAYTLARTVLVDNRHILDNIAQVLLEKETLDGAAFEALVSSSNPVFPGGAASALSPA